jgi:D-amino-acid dehydrogenase
VDRRDSVARETSFANAGLISPGHAYAWASPRAPWILLKSLYRSDTALRFHLRADPRMWSWSLRFLANCTAERNRHNTIVKLKLCLYSLGLLDALRRDTGLAYHEETNKGCLFLFRDPAHYQTGVANMAVLNDHGAGVRAISMDACIQMEPALAHMKDKLAGALHSPKDQSGDALVFTERLAEMCRARGVTFELGRTIRSIESHGNHIIGLVTDKGAVSGDRYVLALGSYSPLLARKIGVKLPIYPVKGYSLTIPIDGHKGAPVMGGVDEGNLVAYSRLGDPRWRPPILPAMTPIRSQGFLGHAACGPRAVPRRRRLRAAGLLGLPPPHDPRRPADHEPIPLPQPLDQQRPRPYGLDHGLRRRADRRGHGDGQGAGYRCERVQPGAVLGSHSRN